MKTRLINLIFLLLTGIPAAHAATTSILIDAGASGRTVTAADWTGVTLPAVDRYVLPDDPSVRDWHKLGLKRHRGLKLFNGLFPNGVKVERDSSGGLRLDFTAFDVAVTEAKNLFAADVLFTVSDVPRILSSAPAEADEPHLYAPKNYDEWYQVVYTSVQHLVQRFGLAGAWYEIGNEPDDEKNGWRGRPESRTGKERLNDFLVLYAWTAKAIQAADPTARVGGPGTAHYDGTATGRGHAWGLRDFLTLVKEFNASVPPDKQLPLDFITWHDYAWTSRKLSDGAEHVRSVTTQLKFAREAAFLVTAWNRESGASCGRSTRQQAASYAAANIARESAAKGARFQALYWSAFDHDSGCANAALLSNWHSIHVPPDRIPSGPKASGIECRRPAYAVFEMVSFLDGGQALPALSADPIEVAAVRKGRSVFVLLANDSDVLSEAAIKINNLPAGNEPLKTRIRRMDKAHSNGCSGLETGATYQGHPADNSLTVKVLLPEYSAILVEVAP